MQIIIRRLFTAAICCAIAGVIFCAINQQQWHVIREKDDRDPTYTDDTIVTLTRDYKQLGLGLFVLSGALIVAAGLVINRYGYDVAAPAKQNVANNTELANA